jgi:MFS family permease
VSAHRSHGPLRLGIRENASQYALLVLVSVFVGGMVGLERAVVPILAEREFGLTSRMVILSFIVGFGIAKAFANLVAGAAGDRFGRKPVLIVGWLVGIPVPFLIMAAPSWSWIVFANLLLGVQQGLCWSTTVIMKIDLAGPARRGFAMGLNEATSYIAVSLAALASGYLAAVYAPRPQPFYLGVAFSLLGLLLSVFWVRETREHARLESRDWSRPARDSSNAAASSATATGAGPAGAASPSFARLLLVESWRDRTMLSASQAGFVNNLNDGMAWGLFPLYFAASGLDLATVGILAAIYPGVWGLLQFATGPLSDRIGRKTPIVAGMTIQAVALAAVVIWRGPLPWAVEMALLGLGTALVYPALIGAVSDVAHPEWRASAVGVYRLWRDTGYAAGALAAGVLADRLGATWAIGAVAALTFVSGAAVAAVMVETLPARRLASARRPAPA